MAATDDKPAVDASVLDAACEGDQDLLEELVQLYLADTPIQLSAARDAIRNGDADELRITAFGMKISAATVGADPLAELCLRLYRDARRGDLEKAPSLLAACCAEFERVKDALSRPPAR